MTFSYSAAEIKAKQVLDDCGLTEPNELTIPNIILGRKAFYEELPLEGKEGEIVSVDDRSIITVNSNIQYEPKKRFAAAHELGHYELHRSLKPIFSDTEESLMNWYKTGSHETEANEFAAEFLMPSELFYKECKGKKFEPKVIGHLANRFEVSKTAAILKFVKRGNHPVFVVYCKNNKMKWYKRSHDFYYQPLFQYNVNPPSGSVAYEIASGKKAYFGDEARQEIWKSDWFVMRDDDEADTKFYEYCMHSPTYGYTLSVVWER